MNRNRNYGIDLLRLICMSMIVLTHLLLHGGAADVASPTTINYWIAWALVALGVGAVNCFAMISGFVSFKSMPKKGRVLELWLQVLFYTGGISAVAMIFFPQYRTINTLLDAVFPIMRSQYWYMTAYFGLILFIPILNIAIEHMSKEMLSRTIVFMIAVFVIFPLVIRSDPYTNAGYSLVWLITMYLLGAYIGKYGLWDFSVREKSGSLKWLLLFLLMIIITFVSKAILVLGVYVITGITIGGGILYPYTSPTIVLASIFLLMACANANIGEVGAKIIAVLSPASLGIYLWHAQPIIWSRYLNQCTVSLLDKNPIVFIVWIVFLDIGICAVGLAIDLIRIKIFALFTRKNEA